MAATISRSAASSLVMVICAPAGWMPVSDLRYNYPVGYDEDNFGKPYNRVPAHCGCYTRGNAESPSARAGSPIWPTASAMLSAACSLSMQRREYVHLLSIAPFPVSRWFMKYWAIPAVLLGLLGPASAQDVPSDVELFAAYCFGALQARAHLKEVGRRARGRAVAVREARRAAHAIHSARPICEKFVRSRANHLAKSLILLALPTGFEPVFQP